MNRIVRERYPVSQLPEDIRREFMDHDEVTLIVEETQPSVDARQSDDRDALLEVRRAGVRGGDFSRYKHLRRSHFKSSEEANEYLSALRDEWAHR